MKIIKNFFIKYKEILSYLVFGVLTTAVNFASFYLLETLNDISYLINNAIAWFISVLFAYVTNKIFVFKSQSKSLKVVIKEVIEFFGARVFSFGIEELGLWLLVDLSKLGDFSYTVLNFTITGELIAKVFLAVIVVIMNYFFSKFVIFAKNNKDT